MLTVLDWCIIAGYLSLIIWVGIALRGRQESVNEYFIAKGSIPGWFGSLLVGLSIAATYFSGISFLAYPSVVYGKGLVVIATVPCVLIYWIVVRYLFLPRFMRSSWSQPYEVIEYRFGRPARRLAASLYMAVRIGWMATLIYAPTIALMSAMDLGDSWFWPLVLMIGLSSTLYTTVGGIRGIIFTEAIQMVIIIGGILITLLFIFIKMPVSMSEMTHRLGQDGYFGNWDMSLNFTEPMTFWAVVIGVSISSIGSYIGDQMSLQRYLTSKNIADAKHSFFVNLVGVAIVITILAAVGLAIAGWYLVNPGSSMPKTPDGILPFFVATELPAGISGLLFAAILAATMSSMASGINALSASLNMDFFDSNSDCTSKIKVVRAKLSSLAIGIVATLSAGLVAHLGQLFDIAQRLLGLFLAPLAVTLIFAVLPVRVSRAFAISGMIIGCITGCFVALLPNLSHWFPQLPVISSLWVSVAAALVTSVIFLMGIRRRQTELPV